MGEPLTILFAFIIFLQILERTSVFMLRPTSFVFVVLLSLFLGYLLVDIFSFLLDIAIITAVIFLIVSVVKKK